VFQLVIYNINIRKQREPAVPITNNRLKNDIIIIVIIPLSKRTYEKILEFLFYNIMFLRMIAAPDCN